MLRRLACCDEDCVRLGDDGDLLFARTSWSCAPLSGDAEDFRTRIPGSGTGGRRAELVASNLLSGDAPGWGAEERRVELACALLCGGAEDFRTRIPGSGTEERRVELACCEFCAEALGLAES